MEGKNSGVCGGNLCSAFMCAWMVNAYLSMFTYSFYLLFLKEQK